MLIEIAVALLSKLSPQLPVMSLSVPIKTLVGFAVLTCCMAVWPRFIEARFAHLLDLAQQLLQNSTSGGTTGAEG
jgi:flagellar biosynthetic protein FliR